jgi:hypothetical protein
LDWLRPKISREMIAEISRNDYGEEVEEHFAAIVAELDGAGTRGIPPWNPREVLELERWSEPDEAYRSTPPTGARGHLKRLLACAILLRDAAYVEVANYGEEDFFVETSADSVLQLARSCLALDQDPPASAIGFLAWLFRLQKHPAFRPYVAFSLLAMAIAANATDADVIELCDWVIGVEDACRAAATELDWSPVSPAWLVGINGYVVCHSPSNNCQRLAAETLPRVARFSSDTQFRLMDILTRLT